MVLALPGHWLELCVALLRHIAGRRMSACYWCGNQLSRSKSSSIPKVAEHLLAVPDAQRPRAPAASECHERCAALIRLCWSRYSRQREGSGPSGGRRSSGPSLPLTQPACGGWSSAASTAALVVEAQTFLSVSVSTPGASTLSASEPSTLKPSNFDPSNSAAWPETPISYDARSADGGGADLRRPMEVGRVRAQVASDAPDAVGLDEAGAASCGVVSMTQRMGGLQRSVRCQLASRVPHLCAYCSMLRSQSSSAAVVVITTEFDSSVSSPDSGASAGACSRRRR